MTRGSANKLIGTFPIFRKIYAILSGIKVRVINVRTCTRTYILKLKLCKLFLVKQQPKNNQHRLITYFYLYTTIVNSIHSIHTQTVF